MLPSVLRLSIMFLGFPSVLQCQWSYNVMHKLLRSAPSAMIPTHTYDTTCPRDSGITWKNNVSTKQNDDVSKTTIVPVFHIKLTIVTNITLARGLKSCFCLFNSPEKQCDECFEWRSRNNKRKFESGNGREKKTCLNLDYWRHEYLFCWHTSEKWKHWHKFPLR